MDDDDDDADVEYEHDDRDDFMKFPMYGFHLLFKHAHSMARPGTESLSSPPLGPPGPGSRSDLSGTASNSLGQAFFLGHLKYPPGNYC